MQFVQLAFRSLFVLLFLFLFASASYVDLSEVSGTLVGSYEEFVVNPCRDTSPAVEVWRVPKTYGLMLSKHGSETWTADCRVYVSGRDIPDDLSGAGETISDTPVFKYFPESTISADGSADYAFVVAKKGAVNAANLKISVLKTKTLTSGASITPCSGTIAGEHEIWRTSSKVSVVNRNIATIDGCSLYVAFGSAPSTTTASTTVGLTVTGANAMEYLFVVAKKVGTDSNSDDVTFTFSSMPEWSPGSSTFSPCDGLYEDGEVSAWTTSKNAIVKIEKQALGAGCAVEYSWGTPAFDKTLDTSADGTEYILAEGKSTAVPFFLRSRMTLSAAFTSAFTSKTFTITFSALSAPSSWVPCNHANSGEIHLYSVLATKELLKLSTTGTFDSATCKLFVGSTISDRSAGHLAALPAWSGPFYPYSIIWIVEEKVGTTKNTAGVTLTQTAATTADEFTPCAQDDQVAGQMEVFKLSSTPPFIKMTPAGDFSATCSLLVLSYGYDESGSSMVVNFGMVSASAISYHFCNTNGATVYFSATALSTTKNTHNLTVTAGANADLATSTTPCSGTSDGELKVHKISSALVTGLSASAAIDAANCKLYVGTHVSRLTTSITLPHVHYGVSEYPKSFYVVEQKVGTTANTEVLSVSKPTVAACATTEFTPCKDLSDGEMWACKTSNATYLSVTSDNTPTSVCTMKRYNMDDGAWPDASNLPIDQVGTTHYTPIDAQGPREMIVVATKVGSDAPTKNATLSWGASVTEFEYPAQESGAHEHRLASFAFFVAALLFLTLL